MKKDTNKKSSLHVKVGDRVILVAGKDKGKVGSVKKVLTDKSKVVVEGLNLVTKAVKANPMANVQGGLTKVEAPLASSNVMVYCNSCEKPTRIKYAVVEDKKVRICKKCGEQID